MLVKTEGSWVEFENWGSRVQKFNRRKHEAQDGVSFPELLLNSRGRS